MATTIRSGYARVLIEAKQELLNEKEHQARSHAPDLYEEGIAEKKERVRQLRRLWKTHKDRPVVQQMDALVQKLVQHFHQDFYYHDLMIMESYHGQFGWLVGECGTHFLKLEAETEEEAHENQMALEVIRLSSYPRQYKTFLVDQQKGTMKPIRFDQLSIRFDQKLVVAR